ncbi:hypothetical protein [Streptomyces sp900116325]|uniref:hypothetical protein n=1 Tax=Streptomyces sp. 900116325 TaxID=3154295 RepID=UPI0033A98DDA
MSPTRVLPSVFDHDLLGPHRGQRSTVAGRGGKWEIHYNPHDLRQIWIRLPGHGLTEIPGIHRDHAHQPVNDLTWQYLRTITAQRAGQDAEQAEAALGEALDELMRRARAGQATDEEQHLLNRTTTVRTPPPHRSERAQAPQPDPGATWAGEDGLDGLDQDQDTEGLAKDEAVNGPAVQWRVRALRRRGGSSHVVTGPWEQEAVLSQRTERTPEQGTV